MINITCYSPQRQFFELENVDEVSDMLPDKNNLVWMDLQDPTPEELDLVRDEFHFHPLAMEDAAASHMRPKINEYDGFYFVVFYSVSVHGHKKHHIHLRELSMFMGGNYLVTIHKLPVPELEGARHRWAQNLEEIDRGIGILLYSLMDAMVDNYFPVLDTLAEKLEKLEDTIYEENSDGNIGDLLAVKRDLLRLRRVLAPERDVLNVLTRRDSPIFNRRTLEYFQDIYDHILRITEAIDNFRDLASSALEARLSVSSNNLNKVMRTMTAATIILMTDALIAGIYGMNFVNIPELHWEYGYFGSLALMLVISIGLLIFFKKRGWF